MLSRLTRHFLFLLCLFFYIHGNAIDTTVLELNDSQSFFEAADRISYIEDFTNSLTLKQAKELLSLKSIENKNKMLSLGYSKSSFWLKFDVINQTGNSFVLDVQDPYLDQVELYYTNTKNELVHSYSGRNYPFAQREFNFPNYDFNLILAKDKQTTIFLKIKSSLGLNVPIKIYTIKGFAEQTQGSNLWIGSFYGLLLLVSFMGVFLFFLTKDISLLYYSLYVFLYGLAMFSLTGLAYQYLWPNAVWWNKHFFTAVIPMTSIPGLFFLKYFFEIDRYYKTLNTIINVLLVVGLLVISLVFISESITTIHITALIYVMSALIFGCYVGYQCWRAGVVYAKFFTIGWGGCLLGIIIKTMVTAGVIPNNIITYNSNYIGLVGEIMFLSLALVIRVKAIENEGKQAQQTLINHLREIDTLKDEINKNLENLVEERTKEIVEKNIAIEKQKQKILEQKATEYNIEALRAQMNPHFIFNSLNSIQNFILKNDDESSSKYLTKFSRLIRMVFENTKNAYIPLERELEALQIYLDLEKLRVNNKFEYEIHIDEKINTDDLLIPSMLIQPFVENSIWHGFIHLEKKGELSISFTQSKNSVLCEIKDNGIGREKAKNIINNSKRTDHKSSGMNLTEERIKLINSLEDNVVKFDIIDLKNGKGEATGTKVEFYLPLKQQQAETIKKLSKIDN